MSLLLQACTLLSTASIAGQFTIAQKRERRLLGGEIEESLDEGVEASEGKPPCPLGLSYTLVSSPTHGKHPDHHFNAQFNLRDWHGGVELEARWPMSTLEAISYVTGANLISGPAEHSKGEARFKLWPSPADSQVLRVAFHVDALSDGAKVVQPELSCPSLTPAAPPPPHPNPTP